MFYFCFQLNLIKVLINMKLQEISWIPCFIGIKRRFDQRSFFSIEATWGCHVRTNRLPYQRQLSRMRGRLGHHWPPIIAWWVSNFNFGDVGTRLEMSCLDDQETSCEISCLEISIILDISLLYLYNYLWYASIADSPLIVLVANWMI